VHRLCGLVVHHDDDDAPTPAAEMASTDQQSQSQQHYHPQQQQRDATFISRVAYIGFGSTYIPMWSLFPSASLRRRITTFPRKNLSTFLT